MHIQRVSPSIFNSGLHFTLSFSTYSSHAAVVPTKLLREHPWLQHWVRIHDGGGAFSSGIQDGGGAFSTGIQEGGGAFSTPETLEWNIVAWRRCALTCGYNFPLHIQCVLHSIFNSGQHFILSFSTYFSHAAAVPSRLLIAHPQAPALGTYTRWRWSILFWYTGWRFSILYLYTGWRWSILYPGDVGVEHCSLETV